jgi:hypothetical protein
VMALFATAVGLLYLLTSIGSFFNRRIAIWPAFVFSTLTAREKQVVRNLQ